MGFRFLKNGEISRLPKTPGVYVFLASLSLGEGGNKGAKLLYIGKAANIRERVKNHFAQPKAIWEQTLLRQGFGGRVGFIKTNSEIEALILEANLIKKYQPKYNVVWRDDKNYFYVGITKEDFPRVFITHQTQNSKTELPFMEAMVKKRTKSSSPVKTQNHNLKLKTIYVGPFVDGNALKQTLKILRKVFPSRTCKNLPKRPCLWYHLGRCPAPCLLKTKLAKEIGLEEKIKKECQRDTENVFEILNGRKIQVLKDLKKEMKEAVKIEDFERAAKIRDQIEALEKILANAKIFEPQLPEVEWPEIQKSLCQILKTRKEISRIEAYDVSNIQGNLATGSMVTFINGIPDKNFYRKFKIKITAKPNDVAMLKEVLNRRFKHPEWPFPDLILIDGGRAQLNVGLRCLTPGVKHLEIIALAKRKNELFIRGQEKPILLKSLPREIFNLILQMRDEAHRFAIGYHKRLREKAMFELAD